MSIEEHREKVRKRVATPWSSDKFCALCGGRVGHGGDVKPHTVEECITHLRQLIETGTVHLTIQKPLTYPHNEHLLNAEAVEDPTLK